MTDEELKVILQITEQRGIEKGIKIVQRKILLACENGTPIEVGNRAFFIKSDVDNLRDIFSDLEADTD